MQNNFHIFEKLVFCGFRFLVPVFRVARDSSISHRDCSISYMDHRDSIGDFELNPLPWHRRRSSLMHAQHETF